MKRRGFLQAMFASTSAALPWRGAGMSSADVTAEIQALLRETEAVWASQDTARLRELWDTDDPAPYYLAGERDDWIVGWEALDRYLAPPGRSVAEGIRVRFSNVRARLLAPDLALAAFHMRTDMKLVFARKPFGADNRVAAICRRKPAGWRYLCYVEAFQPPNIYLQRLMEKDLSSDYTEFHDSLRRK